MIRFRDLVLVFVGALVAGFFIWWSTAFARSKDGSPVLILVTNKGDVVALYGEPEMLCKGKFRATWFINSGKDKGKQLRACYLLIDLNIQLELENGEVWTVPLSAFSIPREV